MGNDDKIRLTHGTDIKNRDSIWLWLNRFGAAFSIIVALICVGGFVYFMYIGDYLLCVLWLIMLLISFAIGIHDALWRNSTYLVTDDYLQIHSALGTELISWESVKGYGINPVRIASHGSSRPYIVLFRSHSRYWFPMSLTFCRFLNNKMIIIRYTEERLQEIAEQLDKHGIHMEPYSSEYCLAEIDDRTKLF